MQHRPSAARATKIIAVWGNSWELLRSRGTQPTRDLCYVIKPPSCLNRGGEPIVLPGCSSRVIFEAELGFVIKHRCRHVSESDAPGAILGWVAVNDVTAQDVIRSEPGFEQYSRAKGFDTFGVVGAKVQDRVDLATVRIRAWHNGVLRQDFGVSDLVRHPYRILAELSRDMTLEPGDIVACGSSVGVHPMEPGDVIKVEVTGVDELVNHVTRSASSN